MNVLRESKTEQEAADKLGVSQQAISDTKHRAERKGFWESRCKGCAGYGVQPCHSCRGQGGHYHTCPTCNGTGAQP